MTVHGIIIPAPAFGPRECGAQMSPKVDPTLYAIAEEAHQHFVDLLNQVLVLKAPTLEEAFQKRLIIYLGTLLNETISEVLLLCTHDVLRRTQPALRSAWEYVIRATYYAQRSSLNTAHFTELFSKLRRLYDQLDVPPTVTEYFEEKVMLFSEAHPDWVRPAEAGLKPILDEMYGPKLAEGLYSRWHVSYSPMTHGTFDGVAQVLGHDGNNTVVIPGTDIANIALAEATRFAFQMATLTKRCYGLTSADTLPMFKRFVKRCQQVRIRVGTPPPFPRPTARFLNKS
jgi:hypothetical protein